jgi:uncharacterized membrane protein
MVSRSFIAVLGLSLAAGTTMAQVSFQRLGLPAGFEPQNPAFSDAYGVSNDGTVVGSMYVPNVGFRSFRWTSATGLTQVNGVNSDSGSFARAITPDGATIVGESTSPQVAFRQTNGGVVENLGILNDIDYDGSGATDVSDNGQAISGVLSYVATATNRAARWTQANGWQDLGILRGDDESAANAISADGSIVAGYSVGSYFRAVKWTAQTGLRALPNPFGINSDSTAIAMSASGDVIVGTARNANFVSQATVWYGNGSTAVLANPSGFDASSAYGVSGDGNLIGGTTFIENVGQDTAAFWTGDGVAYNLQEYLSSQNIDLSGWQLLAITEVSQNGRYLTGRGYNPEGDLESFIVQIPAPGTVLPALVGLIAAGRRRR